MAQQTRDGVRNVAIIAHVDHGKTSLVDAILWQCEMLASGRDPGRLLESADPEREKSVAILPPLTSFEYRGTRTNVLDTPHADLGGEVERTMRIVEGVILLVDASEGPAPQTRYALRKALESGLTPIVVLNKIDLPQARPTAVADEIRSLFVDLDASEDQLGYPLLYCNGVRGSCRRAPDAPEASMVPLLEEIVRTVPAPRFDPETPLQFLITALDYDDFLGRMALGRVVSGSMLRGQAIAHCRTDATIEPGNVTGIYGYEGLRRVEREGAQAGVIFALTGSESVRIGETLADPSRPEALPPAEVDEPTVVLVLSVNDSPMAGLDGSRTGASELREWLWKELLTNATIRVEETESAEAFRLSGRGELQLAILIEMMRREGYELQVAKPEVVTRRVDDRLLEPMELLVVDCPEGYVGVVTEKVGARRGRITKMVNHGAGRVRMEFRIPSRGLLGYRADFLSDTRGSGIFHHAIDGWEPWMGDIASRTTGSLVADRPGRATAHAIGHLQHRGTIFVGPGEEVYEGMVVGENSRPDDVMVDVTKERRTPDGPGVAPAPPPRLIPPRSMSLEQALEFLREDEVVEVTPRSLRIRKRMPGRKA